MLGLAQYDLQEEFDLSCKIQCVAAFDRVLQREVLIQRVAFDDEVEKERLLVKARKLAAFRHPVFIKIHAIEEFIHDTLTDRSTGFSGALAIVFERVQGVSLKTWIVSNSASLKYLLIVIGQIAEALQEAHAAQLVHGHLKTDDVIVDQAGRVRLSHLGFALADVISTMNKQPIVPVDVAYWAPERYFQKSSEAPADVFALGTILYELIAGVLPHATLGTMQLNAAQAQNSSELWHWPETVQPVFRELVLGMTRSEVSGRYTAMQVAAQCREFWEREHYSNSLSSANLIDFRQKISQSKLKLRWSRIASIAASVAIICGILTYLSKPNWSQVVRSLTPYSESGEFEQAVQAILLADQPGMLENAERHFETMLTHDASNANAVAGLSIIYSIRLNSDKRDEAWRERALASAQQALKLNPDSVMTQLAYAKALDPHEQYDLAIKAAKRAIELAPDNLLAWRTEIHILLIAQKYEDLSGLLDLAINKFPDDWYMSMYKGILHINQRKYLEAERVLRISVSQRPDASTPYSFLAMALTDQGKLAEALQVLQQGLQVRPNANLYSQFAEIKFKENDFEAAVSAWQKSVSPSIGNPGDYYSWKRLGDALMMKGKHAESINAFREAQRLLEPRLNRRPNSNGLLISMINIHYRLGQFQKARELIDHALGLFPRSSDFYVWSALVHDASGARKAAIADILDAERFGATSSEIESDSDFSELLKDPLYIMRHRVK